jgi:ATP-dependent Clp protease, protease subunit
MSKETKKSKAKESKVKEKKSETDNEAVPVEVEDFIESVDDRIIIVNNIEQPSSGSNILRNIALYGDLTESMSSDIVQSFMFLKELGEHQVTAGEEDECKPIEFLISTCGGVAAEMFAIYDTMRLVQSTCAVSTIGMGKVMSAGVVLLAAGTKGQRKIGANCRVMIHSVNGGYHGSLSNMENEIAEVRWIQDRYVECLAAESNMSEREIRKCLKKHVDVYLSAEEAVELGIADIIV